MKKLVEEAETTPTTKESNIGNFINKLENSKKSPTLENKVNLAFNKNLNTNKEFKVEKVKKILTGDKFVAVPVKKIALEIINKNQLSLSLRTFVIYSILIITLRFIISLIRKDE